MVQTTLLLCPYNLVEPVVLRISIVEKVLCGICGSSSCRSPDLILGDVEQGHAICSRSFVVMLVGPDSYGVFVEGT